MTGAAQRLGPAWAEPRRRSGLVLVVALCGTVVVCGQVSPLAAQATGRNAVVSGIKLYDSGRADQAVAALSAAIAKGGLSPQDLAKAFHYRGLAYRKQKQPALAIADLTSAVWLKDGLSDAERATALEARAGAYREAGLPDPGPPPGMRGQTPSATAPQQGTSSSAGTAASSGQGLPTPPSGDRQTQSPPSGNPLAGVGSFFSGLFGGSGATGNAAQTANATAPIETASTAGTSAASAVSAWSSATDVVAAEPGPVRTARAAPPATPPPASAAAKGEYMIQVAALRTRAEAEKLAGELTARHRGDLNSRGTSIDETVFGTMGTFYRVSVGPFTSTAETEKVCRAFTASGYDCLVVTR